MQHNTEGMLPVKVELETRTIPAVLLDIRERFSLASVLDTQTGRQFDQVSLQSVRHLDGSPIDPKFPRDSLGREPGQDTVRWIERAASLVINFENRVALHKTSLEALRVFAALVVSELDGTEWDSETMCSIANYARGLGFEIRNPDDLQDGD